MNVIADLWIDISPFRLRFPCVLQSHWSARPSNVAGIHKVISSPLALVHEHSR